MTDLDRIAEQRRRNDAWNELVKHEAEQKTGGKS